MPAYQAVSRTLFIARYFTSFWFPLHFYSLRFGRLDRATRFYTASDLSPHVRTDASLKPV